MRSFQQKGREHKRALVQGFRVKSRTVVVSTNLTGGAADINEARELCHDLGAFIWANENRHFGLENINIVGATGRVLSTRIGQAGKVQ
jgi:hypothetical protein